MVADPHIKDFKEQHSLTQVDLASLLGCGQAAISRMLASGRNIRVEYLGTDESGRMKIRSYEVRDVPAKSA